MTLSTFRGYHELLHTIYAQSDMPIWGHMPHVPPASTSARAAESHRPVVWTAGAAPGNYFAGGTNRVPSFASLSSCRMTSFPIASIRLMLFGLNCGSYGLRAGPPATSSTASNR